MKINICLICVVVSVLWLAMSIGVAFGYLARDAFLIPIALLMGGSVAGIAYIGEKRRRWAAAHPLAWKSAVITVGMPIAYLFVTRLNKLIVVAEVLILLVIAYFLFIRQPRHSGTGGSKSMSNRQEGIGKIEEQMEQCC